MTTLLRTTADLTSLLLFATMVAFCAQALS